MKTTRHLLTLLFCGFLLVSALMYICGEFLQCDMTLFAGASRQTRFIVSTLMILLTISLLPLSLRLFKFRRVSDDLHQRQAAALRHWGTLRICVIGLLLVVNTFLYYAFELESTYGYLAVVVLLCMPFIVPTKSRCEAEVQPEEPVKKEEQPENDNDEETNGSHSQL